MSGKVYDIRVRLSDGRVLDYTSGKMPWEYRTFLCVDADGRVQYIPLVNVDSFDVAELVDA